MDITRRAFFTRVTGVAATSVGGIVAPTPSKARARRVSQDELTTAIAKHQAWTEDESRGCRAVFNHCDLSGLDLGSGAGSPVDLRGSDFSGSDMSGVTGRDVSFFRAAVHDVRLSWSRFESVTFSYASLRRAKCDNIVWGWDPESLNQPCRADPGEASGFQHMDAGQADFTRAKLRGFFWETNFVATNLREADLSYSHFCGTGFSETTFHGADLTSAKFRFAKLSHVKFPCANCAGIDLANAEVGYWVRPQPISA